MIELTAALGEGWNEKKVYRWLRTGRFPGVTQPGGPGSEYVIPGDTVERLMAQDRNGKEA